jgi:opacity protein-like surface antigen
VTQDIDNIAGLRLRAGLPVDDALLFVSAGWGWAVTEYEIGAFKDEKKVSGPSFGIGLQYAASDHVSWRLEYIHYDYGKTTYDLAVPTRARTTADVITFGLDYAFH